MRFFDIRIIGVFLLIVFGGLHLWAEDGELGYSPRHGDVIFQSFGSSPLVDMIEGATASEYSHCGIIFEREGEWFVIEAIGPVREIPMQQWLGNGEKDGFAAYRLKPQYDAQIDDFILEAQTYLGRPYDIRYRFDDENIYCSELLYKAFLGATGETLGVVNTLGQLDWKPHEDLIRRIENGGEIPLERKIITPVAVARAEQLDFVYAVGIAADPVSAILESSVK